jgi:mono/diheme cytochrome c family protein
MKSSGLRVGAVALLAIVIVFALAGAVRVSSVHSAYLAGQAAAPNIPRGAMLYDKWYAVLGVDAPAGNQPIWSRQTTNTISGPDTWRCVTCHGWDYQGKDGAYRAGSNYTGFPGLYTAMQTMSVADITAALKGQQDPQHDFSKYLDDASIGDLAGFLKNNLIDDTEYIDPVALKVKGGDAAKGKELFDAQCATCHGADGKKIVMSLAGRDAFLGTIADVDPWRFLHKTRFGTPGTQMVIGYDLNWTAQEGRDVLLYAQTLPSGLEAQTPAPSLKGQEPSSQPPAGPVSSFLVSLMTAFGAVATGLGFAVILGAFLVGVIFLIVWLLRERRK